MPKFTDSQGDDWSVAINVDAIIRLKDAKLGNFADPLEGDPPPLARLHLDFLFLAEVLFGVCYPQAEERKIDFKQFGVRLGGEALAAANGALMEGLVDFFRQLGRQEIVTVIRKQQAMVEAGLKLAETKAEEIDVEAEITKIEQSTTGD
jgi:hypothetical protein